MTYSVFDYSAMIADRPRAEAFDAALAKVVQPGDVVLDIGTGTGVFALLALRHGARKVYAIEPNPAIQVARDLVAANGASDRVELIQGLSTEVELPEKADVVVSDIRGAMPLFRGHIPAIVDARARHRKERGTLLPLRDTLHVVPVATSDAWDDCVGRWPGMHFDLETKPLLDVLANTVHGGRPEKLLPLADPRTWGVLDYETVESSSLHGEARWTLEEPGTLYGYHLWFDMELTDGITITNAPDREHLIYGSVFLPLARPLDVAAGDGLAVGLLADYVNDEYIWRWETDLEPVAGEPTRERQSTMRASLMSLEELQRREAGHVPRLRPDAALDHEILGALREGRPLGEIARAVASDRPERFPDWHRALAYVSGLYLRYAEPAHGRARSDDAADR